jgi:LysM repeat protein
VAYNSYAQGVQKFRFFYLCRKANFGLSKQGMKNFCIIISVLLFPLFASSQEIMASTEKGVAFIEHPVTKSQGIQAIASSYKANYSEVLKLNNLNANSVLKEGQTLKIPIQQLIKAACDGPNCTKVYHTVKQSEGLYRIGVNYGNIKMAQLKALNNLSGETVSIGQKILVGYLPLAVQTAKTVVLDAPAVVAETVTTPQTVAVEVAAPKPPVVEKKPLPDTVPVVKKTVVVATPTAAITKPENEQPVSEPVVAANKSKGFFAAQFLKGSAELAGLAASFKSESGWQDAKFYILMNDVPPGTVVMVALSANTGTYIYAKVLGTLPQVKENASIKFRLNDAGAAALGVGQQDSFKITVVY